MGIPQQLAFPPSALRGVTAGGVLGNEIGSSGTRGKVLSSTQLKAIVEASGISYLPLAGGTLTGALSLGSNGLTCGQITQQASTQTTAIGIGKDTNSGYSIISLNGSMATGSHAGIHGTAADANIYVSAPNGGRLRYGNSDALRWSSSGVVITGALTCVDLTVSGPITGTSGLIEQRNGLNAQCFDIFETYTSGTNNGKLRLKATSSGHQIGSARASSGSNRTVNFGHFDASDVFTAALKIGTDGHVMFPTGLYDNANQRQMAFGGGFIQVDQNLYVQQPIFHAARSTITVDNNYGSIWVASTSGTKDGVTYAVGDVLITTVTSSVSKTVLLVDYSAI